MTSGIEVAKEYLGCHEKRDRTKLLNFFKQYLKRGEYLLDPSTTAWCARFIGCCERAAGNLGTGRDNARSYLIYGFKIGGPRDYDKVREGDICVFERTGSPVYGHVTYFVGQENGRILCCGGNQSDEVNYSYYPESRLISIRRAV